MSNRLEQFIRDNRESFDDVEPSPAIWKGVKDDLKPSASTSRLVWMNSRKLVAAAAVLVLILAAIFLFLNKSPKNSEQQMAGNTNPTVAPDLLNEINPTYAKEVYHFTQLIELKQDELKQIGKDQPELYKQFVGDITRLDSSYNALKKELPANPNREQLLEAMIQNLQLQTELLNQQLFIIKKIKQSKQSSDGINSKSI
jgi:hypothetical protein